MVVEKVVDDCAVLWAKYKAQLSTEKDPMVLLPVLFERILVQSPKGARVGFALAPHSLSEYTETTLVSFTSPKSLDQFTLTLFSHGSNPNTSHTWKRRTAHRVREAIPTIQGLLAISVFKCSYGRSTDAQAMGGC